MNRKIDEYEARARECVRLAYDTDDEPLREQLQILYRCYLDYIEHLREREPRRTAEVIPYAVWCMPPIERVA